MGKELVIGWRVCGGGVVFVTIVVARKAKIMWKTNSLVVYRVLFRLLVSCSLLLFKSLSWGLSETVLIVWFIMTRVD